MIKSTLLRRIFALALAAGSISAWAYEPVPADPAVRTGTLDNGLTYYVRRNAYPEHRADFFIAQRVGSVQEDESQRGLAHFLEHMCFNGTRHFPGNSLITYLESIGVKFGANLNAYTSTDETVYNICNVPTARRSSLDSCFLVLSDWGNGLLLKGSDIDAERGVIEGEWRMRTSAANRMLERALPQLYPGSLYGQRMPIGLMSVVKNFKHKQLRDYYKKWYHPSNQAIIVVGDIDPDYAVDKIKQLFGNVKNPKNAVPVTPVEVPDNEQLIVSVESDGEQSQSMVRLLYKHADLPAADASTTRFFENDYLNTVVSAMLAERLKDLSQEPSSPFTRVVAHDRNYMISKTRQAFEVIAFAKPGMEDSCAAVMAREVARAVRFGFTDSEYRRARINYESQVDALYSERDKYSNTRYARDFVRAFLDGEPIPSIDDFRTIVTRVIDGVTLSQVNAHFNSLISPTERNVALVAFCTADAKTTPQSLTAAFRRGKSATVTAYTDSVRLGRLLMAEPVPGRIVAEDSVPGFGAKVWTLSNGIKVYVKPTTFKADEVVMGAAAPGGLSLNYNAADAPSLKAVNSVMSLSAYGQFTGSELKKLLAGKRASVRTFISRTEQGLQGSASPRDLATLFQLTYLKLTSPRKDVKAFNQYLEQNRVRLQNQKDPKFEFADSIFSNVFARHPLGAEKLSKQEVERVDYDKIMAVYRDRFSDCGQMDFYIVGNFNTDTLRTLVEKYVASLPSKGRVEKPVDIGYRLFNADKENFWQSKMQTPQSKVYFFWTNDCPLTLRNRLLAKITGQVFSAIFLKEIREDHGWTYHIDTHCSVVADMNGNDHPVIFMPLNVTVTAGKSAETRSIVTNEVARVARDGVTAAQLNAAKQYLRKVYKEDLDDNTYWMVMIKDRDKYGIDFNTNYLSTLDSITPADVRDFVKLLQGGHRLTLTMDPAN
ncbi:MAG: insulinase family protein [Sodaliphilus sp.]|nr:insulinase family protein [Sodaliphilus sp.]